MRTLALAAVVLSVSVSVVSAGNTVKEPGQQGVNQGQPFQILTGEIELLSSEVDDLAAYVDQLQEEVNAIDMRLDVVEETLEQLDDTGRLVLVRRTVRMPSHLFRWQSFSASAACPDNSIAVAGGGDTNDSRVILRSSYPAGRYWVTAFANNTYYTIGTNNRYATVYATCQAR